MCSKADENLNGSYSIRRRTRCPHCWNDFATEDVLAIAESPDLFGDSRLGENFKERFLPIRFDATGAAIDRAGFPCRKLACPFCHLRIPRSYFETKPFFFSVAGAPFSGKSYFLTSAVWRLRRVFSDAFDSIFSDSDPDVNAKLIENETSQFLRGDGGSIPKLAKTQEQGEGYHSVLINHRTTRYLQPYLFGVFPKSSDDASNVARSATTLALYDNAGESFLPAADLADASAPVTRHLGRSDALIFVYDPTQDVRFSNLCSAKIANFEAANAFVRQELVFTEVVKRTRENLGIDYRTKYDKPTIIVLSKFDVWCDALKNVSFRDPWARTQKGGMAVFLENRVRDVSAAARELLLQYLPEIVASAENFASDVVYIPTSATGEAPFFDETANEWRFDSQKFQPIWAETPFLFALARAQSGAIPLVKK